MILRNTAGMVLRDSKSEESYIFFRTAGLLEKARAIPHVGLYKKNTDLLYKVCATMRINRKNSHCTF